ncbi:FecCD family ABC transporter permease [Microbacterium karelineae]|uniref:FecCD family ABC transporter permease n=1 Tax=Microbacterium karelineae TaxID=2654283 RepID=UPI0012EA6710|nr:iron ABC transporter permease [Microbacterium karelineae]
MTESEPETAALSGLLAREAGAAQRGDHTRVEVPRGPAPLPLRLLAAIADAAVAAAPAIVGALIVHSLRDVNGGGQADRLIFGAMAVVATAATYVWNLGFAQGRTGSSVGKTWFGLVARGRDGQPLGARSSLLLFSSREVVRRATAVDEGFVEHVAEASPASMRTRRITGLVVCALLLLVVALASVAVGARPLSLAEIGAAIAPPYGVSASDSEIIVRSLRLPRTLLALVTGLALGMAGAMIQGHTRNPLADPGILGVSAGAACAVVLATLLLGVGSATGTVWFALAGSFVATIVVFGLAAMGGRALSPISLILGGAAMAAFLSSITAAVVLLDQDTLDSYRFWVVGSVAARGLDVLTPLLPFFAAGMVIALASAPGLNLMSLGEDVARSLGGSILLSRIAGVAAITLLAGTATAACGPIGFVGLVVPHIARAITGPDYRWILPYSALIGATLLTICDVIGRVVVRPGELQVGIVLALVGGPFFIALVRRRKLASL